MQDIVGKVVVEGDLVVVNRGRNLEMGIYQHGGLVVFARGRSTRPKQVFKVYNPSDEDLDYEGEILNERAQRGWSTNC